VTEAHPTCRCLGQPPAQRLVPHPAQMLRAGFSIDTSTLLTRRPTRRWPV